MVPLPRNPRPSQAECNEQHLVLPRHGPLDPLPRPPPATFLAPSHPETLAELIWSHLSVKPGSWEGRVQGVQGQLLRMGCNYLHFRLIARAGGLLAGAVDLAC